MSTNTIYLLIGLSVGFGVTNTVLYICLGDWINGASALFSYVVAGALVISWRLRR